MEEQINKKNILIVFSALLLVFLFFHKGFILSGEEYTEEYNSFLANLESSKKSAMKKGSAKENQGSSLSGNLGSQPMTILNKKEIKIEQKSLYEVMEALENIKLNLGSMKHNIKSKLNLLNNVINNGNEEFETLLDKTKLENFYNSTELINTNSSMIRKYSNNIEELNRESENDIEKMWESLEKQIEILRSMSNSNLTSNSGV
jgi:hypothetical protein